ncbi:MAG: aldo/keto reductase [Anaerolineae bacterium]|nr:aldo/keto reductase [Gemmatimonadaceae bacterium]
MHLERRLLGKTGFQVSTIGLGAWGIGGVGYGPVSHVQGAKCVEAYLDRGGNFIDTSNNYDNSESIIGNVLSRAGARSKVILASKASRLDRPGVRQELEETLRALRCDYLDLYYLHRPPHEAGRMNSALDIFEEFKVEGKIRAVGVSVQGPDVNQKSVDNALRYIRSGRVDAVQLVYSIARQKHAGVFQEAFDRKVGIVCRTVLESGFLTGKYPVGHSFDDHRRKWTRAPLRRLLEAAEELNHSARSNGNSTPAQVAIRFVLDDDRVASAILGAKTVEQVSENMNAASSPALNVAFRSELVSRYACRTEEFNTGEKPPRLYQRLFRRISRFMGEMP